MRTERVDGAAGRRVLTAMIVNKTVLGRVTSVWGDPPPFDAGWLNEVGGWCVEHYRRYGEAPGPAVGAYYEEKAPRLPRDEARNLEEFLADLSGEYERLGEEVNPDHVVDVAGKLFDDVRLRRLTEAVDADRAAGRLDAAKARVTKFTPAALGAGKGVDLFVDPEAIRSTYAKEVRDPLVVYPGGLGRFFGSQLGRDCFVAFMGPEKSGKSWWLLDVAWRAMCQRRRVAFFQVGDLSESQVKDRFLVRAMRHPSRSEHGWPCSVRLPKAIKPPLEEDGPAEVEYEDLTFDKPFDSASGWEEDVRRAVERETKSRRSFFRLWCSPTRSATVATLRAEIDAWMLQDWVPDVVVIDYADILAPEDRREEPLHQIKRTWEELRKLSQTLHCLLVTATQVNAESYKKRRLDRSNFSGNHLKFAEVTAMYGVNVTAAEKERQVCRLNSVAQRTGDYSPRRDVHVAQCLALSRPAVRSYFPAGKGNDRRGGEPAVR